MALSLTERPAVTKQTTDEQIAERMLAAALLNYRRATTTRDNAHAFKTWDEMTDIEQGFYLAGVQTANTAIWGRR